MNRYLCTECDTVYVTFNEAARCHWGIGGVEEVEDDDIDPNDQPTVVTFTDGSSATLPSVNEIIAGDKALRQRFDDEIMPMLRGMGWVVE